MLNAVTYGILMNISLSEKLSDRNKLKAFGFLIQHSGNGVLLYNHQDKIFEGKEIFVGIEMQTGYFHVEGSSQLWDELFAF